MLTEKRADKAAQEMFKGMFITEEQKWDLVEDLGEVFVKHGITDFYLMGFKSGKSGAVGFNMMSLSDRILPIHIAKKLMDFLVRLPEDAKDFFRATRLNDILK